MSLTSSLDPRNWDIQENVSGWLGASVSEIAKTVIAVLKKIAQFLWEQLVSFFQKNKWKAAFFILAALVVFAIWKIAGGWLSSLLVR